MYRMNYDEPMVIPTDHGRKRIQDIVPGDCVYEWGTSTPIKVIDNIHLNRSYFKFIFYSDGRAQRIHWSEKVYAGHGRIVEYNELVNLSSGNKFHHKPLKEIELPALIFPDSLQPTLVPDPMTMAAFCIFGNPLLKDINLPRKALALDDYLFRKYHMKETIDVDHQRYFAHENDTKRIEWTEFLHNIHCYHTEMQRIIQEHQGIPLPKHLEEKHYIESNHAPVIPDVYFYAPLTERWKLVRGIFELGYDETVDREHLAIIVPELTRPAVQGLLWSLGIMTRPDPFHFNVDVGSWSNETRLLVIGDFEQYPGMFYNAIRINKFDYLQNIPIINSDRKIRFRIVSADGMSQCDDTCPIKRDAYQLRLEKPECVYFGHNCLPRVSA